MKDSSRARPFFFLFHMSHHFFLTLFDTESMHAPFLFIIPLLLNMSAAVKKAVNVRIISDVV